MGLSLLLMLMLMLRPTTEVTAMATEDTVDTEVMVATTAERGMLMLLLSLLLMLMPMLMPMLRPTTGVMAMATGATEATMVATGADTGAKGIHHFQNSVRVLCIRPNDFKAL